MITDDEKTVVYTITGYIPSTIDNEFQIGQVDLPQDGTIINVKCIQGIAVKYDINGDTVITPQHLDSENRIYFNVSNVAENGIFITNVGQTTNYGQWQRRDNLLIEDYGNYFYKFGITADGTSCYLEFPEDCEVLMKDGVEITYIRSDGAYGNVIPNQLSNFYSDLAVINSVGNNVVLNASNVKIRNYFASTNGKDYENINDAYKNYKRVVGTFNTLVTLRDYFNYIVSNNLASNGFVCDRSNDLQNVYNIMTSQNGINQLQSVIEETSGTPDLTAFSIKLYLTKYFEDVSTSTSFNGTFQPVSAAEAENIQQYVEDIKSLQHDFVALESPTDTFSHFCMFKNKYPVQCVIIPQYTLSNSQKNEVIDNIKLALYQYLNAKEIEFGDKIQDDYLYQAILQADNRIKNVILDNINYTTYAVWYDSNTHLFNETQISGDIEDKYYIESTPSTLATNITVNVTKYLSQLTDYNSVQFTYSGTAWQVGEDEVDLEDYGITISTTPSLDDSFSITISKQTQFRSEVLAKSILAGVTPFIVNEEEFKYQMNQILPYTIPELPDETKNTIIKDIVSIYPKTTITISSSESDVLTGSTILRNNESIEFLAPNLLPKETYNNYVKYECSLSEDVEPNVYYMLKENEYIVFYWKSSSSDTLYSFAMYGEGSIIKSSFLLTSNNNTQVTSDLYTRLSNIQSPKVLTSDQYSLNFTQSQEIQNLRYTTNILSDNKEVQYFITNDITIDNTMYCYWVLNTPTITNESSTYVLFPNGSTSRLLDVGEYFFYADKELTNFITLGEGTLITKGESEAADSWTVTSISLTDITLNGISALNGYWYKPQGFVNVTEQQFITINSGYELQLKLKNQNIDPDNPIDSWSVVIDNEGSTFNSTTSGEGSAPVLHFSDFYISYRPDPQSSQKVMLPDLNLSEELSWSAKSLLSINLSPTTPQILLENQSVILTINGYPNLEDRVEISGRNRNITYNRYPVVLLSNRSIQLTGAMESSTIYYNTQYEPQYLSLYVFGQQGSRDEEVRYDSDVIINTIVDGGQISVPIPFILPPGDYILPVFIPKGDSGTASMIENTVDSQHQYYLYPVYDSKYSSENVASWSPDHEAAYMAAQLDGGMLYPLYLHSETNFDSPLLINSSLKILYVEKGTFNYAIATKNLQYRIYNPIKYTPSDDINKNIALIRMFDKNNIFDYTYTVNPDVLIEDPLEAKQFLNSNHIYNKFTICQLDTSSNTKITVN